MGLLEQPNPVWLPQAGPQLEAYLSPADVIGYGGAAGGGKTDLAIGKALTQHKRVAIFRRDGTELSGIIDRLEEVLGSRDGFAAHPYRTWKVPGTKIQIEFGSVPNPGDERKYQGRPKDLLALDEATNFLEAQVRFLMGWVRSTDKDQHCQVLMTFNPPTSAEGRWIIDYFGPWLDSTHPLPAQPGELRWFATINGVDREVVDGTHFKHKGELIKPLSRTFIPSRVGDNSYLAGTNYMATLQALPEPLRSQMLYGDFTAGMEDDPWQVIPTKWVDAAMARWKAPDVLPPMDSLGVDVARGGKDNTILARRHGMWFDVPLAYAGKETPDGPMVAGLTAQALRDQAVIHIDVIGVGSSPYDFLRSMGTQIVPVNVAVATGAKDRAGVMGFANLRTELWWRMREALDPVSNTGIALPPDRQLLADLCAPKWAPIGKLINVEDRAAIIKRIGRSPDWASAYLLALMDTPKVSSFKGAHNSARRQHDPYAKLR